MTADRLLHLATFSLQRMAAGGMRDHLGGGFHRYSGEGAAGLASLAGSPNSALVAAEGGHSMGCELHCTVLVG
jgi:hypothetical protein